MATDDDTDDAMRERLLDLLISKPRATRPPNSKELVEKHFDMIAANRDKGHSFQAIAASMESPNHPMPADTVATYFRKIARERRLAAGDNSHVED